MRSRLEQLTDDLAMEVLEEMIQGMSETFCKEMLAELKKSGDGESLQRIPCSL